MKWELRCSRLVYSYPVEATGCYVYWTSSHTTYSTRTAVISTLTACNITHSNIHIMLISQSYFLFTWTHQKNTINGAMTMRNIGVRAEHMSSTFSVYQKVRIHMSILSGMWESIVSTSLLKRFSNRPVGVLSKKACGACKTLSSMLRCMRLAASSILWIRHNRQLTNNSTPVRRGKGSVADVQWNVSFA